MIEHRGISTPGFPAPPALTSAAEFLRVANYATSQMRSKVREGGTALRFVHTKCYRQFEFGKLSEREVVAIVLVHWRQDDAADRQRVWWYLQKGNTQGIKQVVTFISDAIYSEKPST